MPKKSRKRGSKNKKRGSKSRSSEATPKRFASRRSSPLAHSRSAVLHKCGSKCFLVPSKLKYPVCSSSSCQYKCSSLQQAHKNTKNRHKLRDIHALIEELMAKHCK